MPIIATAGHVDHGKSTLVEALTGRDPDRWPEEKERGLTIDLGFAWTDIGGQAVGFVDVPGHERFIKNMLAGVGAVDCALLVVAADSGWMPQTEEHAAVLSLLNTAAGVIALTRTDLVDTDTVELATLEILEEIEGTPLSDWPIVPVSGITGYGLDVLVQHLAARITSSRSSEAPFRMWIDRSFTIRGAGLVVTGSVAAGSIRVGDDIEVLPFRNTIRVRGLHRHDTPTDRVLAGDRAAINLASGSSDDIGRGNLMATPSTVAVTSRLLGTIVPTRSFDEVPRRGAFHIHIGTADTAATIRRIAGTDGFLITTAEPVAATVGDRFILRDSGRRAIVGGGRTLDPQPHDQPQASDVAVLLDILDAQPDDQANALLERRGIATAVDLALGTGGGRATEGLFAGRLVVARSVADSIASEMRDLVGRYHASYPLRPGMGKAELASQLRVADDIVPAVVEISEGLSSVEGAVRLAGFTNDVDSEQEHQWIVAREALETSFNVPRMSAIPLPAELLHAVMRRGDLVQIDDDLAFTDTQVSTIIERVRLLPAGFTVSAFKDHFGMTRRQAVPMLEWLDRTGVTVRSGDGRVARQQPS